MQRIIDVATVTVEGDRGKTLYWFDMVGLDPERVVSGDFHLHIRVVAVDDGTGAVSDGRGRVAVNSFGGWAGGEDQWHRPWLWPRGRWDRRPDGVTDAWAADSINDRLTDPDRLQ